MRRLRHRPANDVAAADHDRMAAGDGHIDCVEQGNDALRRARRKGALEPVDVLLRRDRGDHRGEIEVRRKRQLDQDAMHGRIGIEGADARQQCGGAASAAKRSVLERMPASPQAAILLRT